MVGLSYMQYIDYGSIFLKHFCLQGTIHKHLLGGGGGADAKTK